MYTSTLLLYVCHLNTHVTCMLHVILTCMSVLHAHTMQNYMHVAGTFCKQACHMNLLCMLHTCCIKHAWKLHVTSMLHAQHSEQGSHM